MLFTGRNNRGNYRDGTCRYNRIDDPGFLAVVLGTLNVVGGFVVTDRMLEMFKKKK